MGITKHSSAAADPVAPHRVLESGQQHDPTEGTAVDRRTPLGRIRAAAVDSAKDPRAAVGRAVGQAKGVAAVGRMVAGQLTRTAVAKASETVSAVTAHRSHAGPVEVAPVPAQRSAAPPVPAPAAAPPAPAPEPEPVAENPVAQQAPAAKKAPAAEQAPAAKKAPAAEHASAAKKAAKKAAKNAPAAKKAPAAEKAPAAKKATAAPRGPSPADVARKSAAHTPAPAARAPRKAAPTTAPADEPGSDSPGGRLPPRRRSADDA